MYFFKLLEKAKDKKRKVTCYSHNKEIKIWAGESEGSGIIAYIVILIEIFTRMISI
jgi:hypothetical protein